MVKVRGQLAIEFLIVVSGLLIILASITMPLYNQARADAEKVSNLADAREVANTLVSAINTLYASGPGSKQIIEYWLPKGVVALRAGGYENVDVDGIDTTDEDVAINGRADVQIWFDFDGDGAWDNERDAVVLVDTLLPSKWDEGGNELEKSWVDENCIHIEDDNFSLDSAHRTYHRVTLEYVYENIMYNRRITVFDEIIESV